MKQRPRSQLGFEIVNGNWDWYAWNVFMKDFLENFIGKSSDALSSISVTSLF